MIPALGFNLVTHFQLCDEFDISSYFAMQAYAKTFSSCSACRGGCPLRSQLCKEVKVTLLARCRECHLTPRQFAAVGSVYGTSPSRTVQYIKRGSVS